MSLWASCSQCEYSEMIPDDVPDIEALKLAGDLAREHVLHEHFALISPESTS